LGQLANLIEQELGNLRIHGGGEWRYRSRRGEIQWRNP
jgi:hypothetical protein